MMKTKTEITNLETGEIIILKADFPSAIITADGSVWVDYHEFWDKVNADFPYGRSEPGPTIPALSKDRIRALEISVIYLKRKLEIKINRLNEIADERKHEETY